MKKVRRRFSREFKLEAVRQLTEGRRLADVARELGVLRAMRIDHLWPSLFKLSE